MQEHAAAFNRSVMLRRRYAGEAPHVAIVASIFEGVRVLLDEPFHEQGPCQHARGFMA